jgi:excisionase family DNA binding protein
MTAQARRQRNREPGRADQPRRPSGPVPPGDDIAAAASQVGQDPPSGRLAYSVDEAARLTGLSRDLLYDEMRRGNLAYVKVGRRRLITRQHLQQFLGIAS